MKRKRKKDSKREKPRRNTTQKGRVTRGSDDVKRTDGYSEKGHGGMKQGKEDCTERKKRGRGRGLKRGSENEIVKAATGARDHGV